MNIDHKKVVVRVILDLYNTLIQDLTGQQVEDPRSLLLAEATVHFLIDRELEAEIKSLSDQNESKDGYPFLEPMKYGGSYVDFTL
ncbi:hypothetical protein QVD17_23272 [Tagetes erecta]|uniref:Uncharacterized protein n=1 Tax=Tagetes erecta TaxID=13708 RepID=A0AAD8KDX0_TARER|nr:hypothetical protein QVD17_23272 [Tagetes erecta]